MHKIQEQILIKMIKKERVLFSELIPSGVASNHVSYHVGKLIEQKILKKTGTGYRLTTVGKSLIDRMSLATFTERIQPKIVTLIVCTNATGDMLLYRRRKQPFLGKVGFPYGKIHMGERVADAAAREFQEKTGLTATMRYRGDVYTAVYDAHHELIVHMLSHVFSAVRPMGILITQSNVGECFWAEPKEIKKEEAVPGFADIARLLKNSPRTKNFFEEYTYHI